MRRNRQSSWMRDLICENNLTVHDLILPLFVTEGTHLRTPIASMPMVERLSIDLIIETVRLAKDLGIKAVALFPVVGQDLKTKLAAEAYNPDNLICRAVASLKNSVPGIGIICDVALDPYTSHGHDGIVGNDGYVLNDETNVILGQQALVLAKAGADIIAPSDMMDGRVGCIRRILDEYGFSNVAILSYAAKYASHFYGPFRDALGSASNLQGADKLSYHMDPRNAREALREVALDITEGADMVMIKPAGLYLDIIRQTRDNFAVPILAYQVSGEYAAIKAASIQGWIDERLAIYESLIAIKRAGASAIITYAALECAKLLK
jgi:porphobilinogen synthase